MLRVGWVVLVVVVGVMVQDEARHEVDVVNKVLNINENIHFKYSVLTC